MPVFSFGVGSSLAYTETAHFVEERRARNVKQDRRLSKNAVAFVDDAENVGAFRIPECNRLCRRFVPHRCEFTRRGFQHRHT